MVFTQLTNAQVTPKELLIRIDDLSKTNLDYFDNGEMTKDSYIEHETTLSIVREICTLSM